MGPPHQQGYSERISTGKPYIAVLVAKVLEDGHDMLGRHLTAALLPDDVCLDGIWLAHIASCHPQQDNRVRA